MDPGTLLGGVAIGFCTALIFGIMPIVQASQIRPQAVLRDLPEGYTASSAALTVFLVVLLGVLFFVLSAVILGSIQLALLIVLIGAVVLGILTAVFTLVVYLISQLPVPESLNLGFAGLVLAGVVVFGGLTWLGFTQGWSGIPAMTALFTAISLLGLVVAFLPRTWKSTIKMALRNIGRQRTRTVTTMVALFIGVFAIGLILALGIGIRNDIIGLLSSGTTYNSFIVVKAADKAAVDKELGKISGIKGELVNAVAPAQPVSVNGQPIGTILKAAATQGTSGQLLTSEEVLSYLGHLVGYDLAANQIPVLNIVSGRNLDAGDAVTNNVIMPVQSTSAPLNLSVGSQIVLLGPDGKTTRTVTVVGFYSTSTGGVTVRVNVGGVNGGGMIADDSVPVGLAPGRELYVYSLILTPKQATSDLNQVVAAVPSAQTVNLAKLTLAINDTLNNLIIMLTAIASLAMIAGVVIIANAVALAMLERRREQGILKSVGYTSASVLSEVLVENGVVGFTGGVLAMLLVSFALFILGLLGQVVEFWRRNRAGAGHHLRNRLRQRGGSAAGGLERHPSSPTRGAALRIACSPRSYEPVIAGLWRRGDENERKPYVEHIISIFRQPSAALRRALRSRLGRALDCKLLPGTEPERQLSDAGHAGPLARRLSGGWPAGRGTDRHHQHGSGGWPVGGTVQLPAQRRWGHDPPAGRSRPAREDAPGGAKLRPCNGSRSRRPTRNSSSTRRSFW